MLNEFNEGGSHETNPLGGIPLGVGENGNVNTVEENETMKGDFIYSDRIIFTPEIVAQFNLPKSLSNKTAAEASKIINNKFEGRNDKITTSTKKSMLDKVAQAQETIKQAKAQEIAAAQQINSTEVPDMMDGEIPAGMEEFVPQQEMMYGGNKYWGGGNLQQGQANGEMLGNLGTTAADMFLPGSGQIIKAGDQFGQQIGSMIGGKTGEQIGSMISPLGTLKGIGTAVTTGNLNDIPGIGLFGGKTTKQKEIQKMKFNKDMFEANSKISDFAMGGNMYGGGGDLKPWRLPSSTMHDDPNYVATGPQGFFKNTTSVPYATDLPENQRVDVNSTLKPNSFYGKSFRQMGKPQISDNLGFQSKLNYNDPDVVSLTSNDLKENNGYSNPELAPTYKTKPSSNIGSTIKEGLNKTGEFIKDNKGVLRYAPVAMNAFQLHKLNKEGYDKVNPIINNTRYNPQYMDERALTNQINAESNYAGNALANASNGSLGALSNSILASQLNKTRALSDAYSKVADVNRNESKAGQQFNLSVDEANIGRRIAAEDKTAMNKGAFKTEQSKLRGQIGTDLGEIGKEEIYKKMAEKVTGYDWMGKYLKANPKATPEEVQAAWDEEQKSKFKPTAQFTKMNFGEGINYKSKYIK